MSKLTLRLVSDFGFNKVFLTSNSKLLEIKQKAADVLNCKPSHITLFVADQKILDNDNLPLSRVKKIVHGTTVHAKSSAPPKGANDEMMTEKTPQAPTSVPAPSKPQAEPVEEVSRPRCQHGPRGKCVHCINIQSEVTKNFF
jgi:hypothetical protein